MELLKERFTQAELDKLISEGIARRCHLRGTTFDEIWNAVYEGNVDITARVTINGTLTHLFMRVDTKDGVPWLVNATFKNRSDVGEEEAWTLAEIFGLSRNKLHISGGHASHLQSFWDFGRYLQVDCRNEDPRQVTNFLIELSATISNHTSLESSNRPGDMC